MSEFLQYSYVRRRGRTTSAQAKALESDLSEYEIALETIATREPPAGVEIGFGMGDALVAWAKSWAMEQPDSELLGIDLYLPGVGSLVNKLKADAMTNVRICIAPAQEVMASLPDACLTEIRILFPDPWPKKRHAKRRLIQPEFVSDLARVVAPQGCVKVATDWDPYAEWIREVFAAEACFDKAADEVRESRDDSLREVTTKFEQRGERLGHRIHDLVYVPRNSATTESR